MRPLIALLLFLLPAAALAQGGARTIEDCERLKEPLAYNACLASFGPARRGLKTVPMAEAPGVSTKLERPRHIRHHRVYARHHGRVRAQFSIGPRRHWTKRWSPRRHAHRSHYRRHRR